jgi:multidrug transporter EmrE-like cation transporter
MMRPYLMIFAVLVLTAYGQLMIKARALVHASPPEVPASTMRYLFAMFTDIGVLSGLAAAVIAGAFWMLALERLQVGYAYPFMALSFVLVPLGSAVLLHEPLPLLQLFGLILIVSGVVVSALAR